MGSKWQNAGAGPRQVKDLQKAMGRLRGEGQSHDEITGVTGGQERRSTFIGMCDGVRPEVTALEDAIKDKYECQVTKANVRAVIADYEAALPEARKSRPVEDNRRTPEEEAGRLAASAKRDAEYKAAQDAQNAVLTQVMAKAPKGAKALIVAEWHEDDSDVQTDYFNSRVTRTVAIGFRHSSREDFRALRAAAGQFPETAHMANQEALNAWTAARGWRGQADDLEHRENYSIMGGGNYLSDHGSSRSGSGWVIKSRDFPCSYVSLTEDAIPEKPAAPAVSETQARAPRSTAVGGGVMDIIGRAEIDGHAVRITERLDRETYLRVNEVLAALGGKWNRKARAHLFPGDAAEVLAGLLSEGEYTKPADEGWFPTPPPIVELMLDMAGVEEGTEVLEPSAGEGALAEPAAARGAVVDCVELNAKRAAKLEAFARTVTVADFLTLPQQPVYDRVLMNPPFAGKADVAHVRHAAGFLRPGGLLIAIMSAGVAFRQDRATGDFRDLVLGSGGSIKPLPDAAFRESGTDVRTVLVTLPVAAERSEAA